MDGILPDAVDGPQPSHLSPETGLRPIVEEVVIFPLAHTPSWISDSHLKTYSSKESVCPSNCLPKQERSHNWRDGMHKKTGPNRLANTRKRKLTSTSRAIRAPPSTSFPEVGTSTKCVLAVAVSSIVNPSNSFSNDCLMNLEAITLRRKTSELVSGWIQAPKGPY